MADGALIIEREGTDLDDAMSKLRPDWKENIYVIHQVGFETLGMLASGPNQRNLFSQYATM